MRHHRLSVVECQFAKFLFYCDISVDCIARCYNVSKSTIYRAINKAKSIDGSCVEKYDELFFSQKHTIPQFSKRCEYLIHASNINVRLLFDANGNVSCIIKTNKKVHVDVQGLDG